MTQNQVRTPCPEGATWHHQLNVEHPEIRAPLPAYIAGLFDATPRHDHIIHSSLANSSSEKSPASYMVLTTTGYTYAPPRHSCGICAASPAPVLNTDNDTFDAQLGVRHIAHQRGPSRNNPFRSMIKRALPRCNPFRQVYFTPL